MTSTIANLLDQWFIARHDVRAWHTDRGYRRDDRPIALEDIERHLAGEPFRVTGLTTVEGKPYSITAGGLGHYLIDPTTQTTKVFCFDIDLNEEGHLGDEPINPRAVFSDPDDERRTLLLEQLKTMAFGLGHRAYRFTREQVQIVASFSGNKGLHVYGLLPGGEPAAKARAIANRVMESFDFKPSERGASWIHADHEWPNLSIEVFPKQDEVAPNDYGNLLRLPLGRHVKSGKPGAFVRLDCEPMMLKKIDPLDVLERGMLPWA